jgi:signal transduction histidine kinase
MVLSLLVRHREEHNEMIEAMTETQSPEGDPHSFAGEDFLKIQKHGRELSIQPGQIIYKEREPGSTLFFIKEGAVQLIKAHDEIHEEILYIRGPGEVLGENSLFETSGRFGTAQALGQTTLIEIDKKHFLDLISLDSHLGFKVINYMGTKMRDSDFFRVRLLQKKNEQIIKSYEELKAAQEELMKSERLAAVGGLASKIVHDIKGTITPLKIYSENLDHLSDEARTIGINTIKLSINRILRICEELLEYVRGAPLVLRRKHVAIKDFIENEVDFLRDMLMRNQIEFQFDLSFQGSVRIDEERMGRVIQNLVMNAKDAMPDGGIIRIETRKVELDGLPYIILQIIDNGCGIPVEFQEKIFEPFVTVGKEKGTGLGLSISKKILEEHGGRIVVESTPGNGATFTLSIPA